MRRATLLVATMMLSLLLASGVALADTIIDTTPQWNGQEFIFPFGHPHPDTATYGQVITAPAKDTQLESFTFFMRLPTTVTFRGEVFAWDGAKATGPNLYESAPRTTSGSDSFEEITFDTGGVRLIPGQQYVLFATISKDYEVSSGSGDWGFIESDNVYAGGDFVYRNNGPDFGELFINPWEEWWEPGTDLAFKAVFSSPTLDTKEDCKKGGYKDFGFKNQGQCIKAVNHAS